MNPISDEIAKSMAGLILSSDHKVLEPYSGKGEIVRHLPPHIQLWALEQNYRKLKAQNEIMKQRGNSDLSHYDFLESALEPKDINALPGWQGYDVIIGCPPEFHIMASIKRSLALLNPKYPHARIIFLLPLSWNCKKAIAEQWVALDGHIHHEYRIVGDEYGLVAYKQYAVFDIRLGRIAGAVSYLIQSKGNP